MGNTTFRIKQTKDSVDVMAVDLGRDILDGMSIEDIKEQARKGLVIDLQSDLRKAKDFNLDGLRAALVDKGYHGATVSVHVPTGPAADPKATMEKAIKAGKLSVADLEAMIARMKG